MTGEIGRPSKKPRLEDLVNNTDGNNNMQETSRAYKNRAQWRPNHTKGHNKRPFGRPQQSSSGGTMENSDDRPQRRTNAPRTFSQPSVITAGDKGVFVTSDKGREKKALIELGDLVEDYLETANLIHPTSNSTTAISEQPQATITNSTSDIPSPLEEEEFDIESTITSELTSLSNNPPSNHTTTPTNPKPFQLITLDIPCVSFLRFHPLHPSYNRLSPTIIVHSICNTAMSTAQIRSRHIRRLSPIFNLQKTLSNGLERCAVSILPEYFPHSPSSSSSTSPEANIYTYAIRPVTRNNDKLPRDTVINYIADQIKLLNPKHKVDLKNYQKGVLVEIYRNWIGMSVVDNQISISTSPDLDNGNVKGEKEWEYGYEELKRFNLAEVYIEAMKRREEDENTTMTD